MLIQLAALPLQQQTLLKKMLEPVIPDIEALVVTANRSDFNKAVKPSGGRRQSILTTSFPTVVVSNDDMRGGIDEMKVTSTSSIPSDNHKNNGTVSTFENNNTTIANNNTTDITIVAIDENEQSLPSNSTLRSLFCVPSPPTPTDLNRPYSVSPNSLIQHPSVEGTGSAIEIIQVIILIYTRTRRLLKMV